MWEQKLCVFQKSGRWIAEDVEGPTVGPLLRFTPQNAVCVSETYCVFGVPVNSHKRLASERNSEIAHFAWEN